MRRSVVWLAAAALCLSLAGCAGAQPAAIKGTVTDNFGQPVAGAEVRIANSAFATKTDDKGQFSIEYVPGSFVVKIGAAGHSAREVALDLRERAEFPLDSTVLTRYPSGKGLFLLGSADYVPLLPARIGSTERNAGMNVAKSYVVEATAEWTEGIAGLAAALPIADGTAEVTFTVVDTTGDQFEAYLSDGNRLGTATYGPLGSNEDGMVAIGEIGREEPADGIVFRRFSADGAALLAGRAICFPRIGRSMIARRLVVGDGEPGYCLAVTPAAYLSTRRLSDVELAEALATMQIVPGEGIGNITIGADRAVAARELGVANGSDAHVRDDLHTTRYDLPAGHSVYIYSSEQQRTISSVRLISNQNHYGAPAEHGWTDERMAELREQRGPMPATAGGVTLYSTADEVIAEFGEPLATTEGGCGTDGDERTMHYRGVVFRVCGVVVDITMR